MEEPRPGQPAAVWCGHTAAAWWKASAAALNLQGVQSLHLRGYGSRRLTLASPLSKTHGPRFLFWEPSPPVSYQRLPSVNPAALRRSSVCICLHPSTLNHLAPSLQPPRCWPAFPRNTIPLRARRMSTPTQGHIAEEPGSSCSISPPQPFSSCPILS